MTDNGFLTIDLAGLQNLISDEDVDLESLIYLEDRHLVSFDALVRKRDHARFERRGKHTLKVYPIVRQTVHFYNVTGLEKRVRRRQLGLWGVTVCQREEGRIEVNGCGGKLVITISDVHIEVGPETESDWECVKKKPWYGIPYLSWRRRESE